jgi:hypothetical protein
MAVASQLIAEVKAVGADTTETQLLAVGKASDAASNYLGRLGKQAFTTGAGFDGMKAAVRGTIPSVAELDAQFATMRERFAQVSAQADREAAALMRSAEASKMAGTSVGGMHEHLKRASSGLLEMTKNALSFVGGMIAMNLATSAVSFLSNAFHGMIQESTNAADELAQTNATIKSTHGVAGVTAKSVLDLAASYSHLTLFTDDAVQSAENVLLTFPRIGKDIFPQTTLAVLNLSQAMHQDWKQSAIEVGKALDDPVRGLTNLRRIGVEFSDAQVKVIKHLWETGHTAEAQKLILKELNKEFGNSAVAAGTTFAGKLKILSQTFDDLKQAIGDRVLPILSQMLTNIGPLVISFTDWITEGNGLSTMLSTVNDILAPLISAIQDTWTYLQPLVEQIGEWAIQNDVAGKALAVLKGYISLLAAEIRFMVPVIVSVVTELVSFISTVVDRVQPTVSALVGFIQTHWKEISTITSGIWNEIRGVLMVAWSLIKGAFLIFIDLLQGNWKQAWEDAKSAAAGVWDGIKTAFFGLVKTVLGYLSLIPGGIGQMARDAQKELDKMTAIVTRATAEWKKMALLHSIQMQQGVVDNLKTLAKGVEQQMKNAHDASTRHALQMKLDAINAAIKTNQGVVDQYNAMLLGINTALGKMKGRVLDAFSQMQQQATQKARQMSADLVGHSIIPDMINKIVAAMAGLPGRVMSPDFQAACRASSVAWQALHMDGGTVSPTILPPVSKTVSGQLLAPPPGSLLPSPVSCITANPQKGRCVMMTCGATISRKTSRKESAPAFPRCNPPWLACSAIWVGA